MNDSDLVRGLRERSPAAVRYLTECWVPSVWRFVFVRVDGDQHLAEDIVSDCVLTLIAAASDPEKEILNVGGWLRSVASNKVNDHFRAAARVQHLLDQARSGDAKSSAADPARQQELKEQQALVRDVLDSLGDSKRMALEWKYIERLSVREIAGRLDITVKAAESILFRARCEFRERFERNNGHVPDIKSVGQLRSDLDSEQSQLGRRTILADAEHDAESQRADSEAEPEVLARRCHN